MLGPVEIFILFFVTLGPLKLIGPFAHATSTADAKAVRQVAIRAFALSTICVVAVLVCGLVGIAVHPAGYVRLEFKEPGDTESWPWPDPAPRRCSSHCRLRSSQMVLYRR